MLYRCAEGFRLGACKLVIGVGSDSHTEQVQNDAARSEWLEQHGYRVISFSNRDGLHNIEGVLAGIAGQRGVTFAQE